MSRQRSADCTRKVGYKVRLENVAAATRFHRGFHKSMVFKTSEEHDFRRRADFLEAASRLKTVHYRHHDVEDENVRLQPQGRFNCLLPVQRGADYFKLEFEKSGDGAEDLFTVIG